MKDFKDKVAVVTGAASGIGRAMAQRFAREGMKVALADIEPPALAEAERRLRADGATVLAVPTDVSKAADVEALARRVVDTFGAVHVLCNNAGVFLTGRLWERTLADWEWLLSVNLWGVVHGVRTFVPLMLRHGEEGHIVNTASMAGLTSMPYAGVYHVSKHAVVTLSEVLHHELAMSGAKVKVSVLCPGLVNTRIVDSERNRPAALRNAVDPPSLEGDLAAESLRQALATGMPPERIADLVHAAIRDERFYIFPDAGWMEVARARIDDILSARNPTFVLPPMTSE